MYVFQKCFCSEGYLWIFLCDDEEGKKQQFAYLINVS